jgi:competence protein ComEA
VVFSFCVLSGSCGKNPATVNRVIVTLDEQPMPITGDNSQGDPPKDASESSAPDVNSDRPPRTLLRRADQLGIAVVALFAIVAIGGYWLNQAVVRERVIDIEKAAPLDPGFRVDINSSEWPELAQLPEIGESLARQIVAWRTAHGPFKDTSDLRRVKGIGPKKFEAIRTFLRPIGPTAAGSERAVANQDRPSPAAAR